MGGGVELRAPNYIVYLIYFLALPSWQWAVSSSYLEVYKPKSYRDDKIWIRIRILIELLAFKFTKKYSDLNIGNIHTDCGWIF